MFTVNVKGQIPINIAIFFLAVSLFFIFIILGLPLQHTAVILLAAVVFVIAFLNTDLALIIVILSMLLSPEVRAGQLSSRNLNIRVEDLFLFIIFFGWMAKMAVKKELGLLRRNPINAPIIVYFTICLISSLVGIISGHLQFKDSFFYLLKYFEYFLIFFMVSNNLRSMRQVKTLVYFLLFTCFIVCVISWFQIPSGERLSAPFESEGGEPNTFAGYLLIMMALMLGLFAYAQGRRQKLLWLSLFGFAFVPFVMTLSREGWVSFIPLLGTFIVLDKKARYPLIALSLAGLIAMPYVLPEKVRHRAEDTFAQEKKYEIFGRKLYVSESTAARIDSWGVAMRRLSRKPFFGYGVPGGKVIDNQYTRVMIETGFLGLFAFLWLLVTLFRLSIKTYRQVQDTFSKGLSLGFICGFMALLVQSLGAAVFILIRVMEPFWFLAALVLTLPEIAIEEKVLVHDRDTAPAA